MANGRSVLLLDGLDGRMTALTERLRGLGFRAVLAKTPEEALELAESRRLAVGAALLAPDLPVTDLGKVLGDLRARAASGSLEFVAVGQRPDDARVLERLHAADVRLALWEPFEDGTLRFQVNRALGGRREQAGRASPRVPTELVARVLIPGREKVATVYTLSAAGAFLETPRPSLPGAVLELELPLEPEAIRVRARVLYTNVAGNLIKQALPVGMAVAFQALSPHQEELIRRHVLDTAESLVMPASPPAGQRRGFFSRGRR